MKVERSHFAQSAGRAAFDNLKPIALSSRATPKCPVNARPLAKGWTKWLAVAFAVMVLCFSLHAQTPQPAPSAGTDRVTFAGSIRQVAPAGPQFASGASATLVRSELTQTESEATIDFSVALKIRDFTELEERIGKGEIISLDELAAKYYPMAADHKRVVDWLIAQGFAVTSVEKYDLSVFASGSVARIERAFGTKFGRVMFAGVESTSALIAPSLPAAVAGPVLGINGLQPHLRPRRHSTITPAGPKKLINNSPPYTVPENRQSVRRFDR